MVACEGFPQLLNGKAVSKFTTACTTATEHSNQVELSFVIFVAWKKVVECEVRGAATAGEAFFLSHCHAC